MVRYSSSVGKSYFYPEGDTPQYLLVSDGPTFKPAAVLQWSSAEDPPWELQIDPDPSSPPEIQGAGSLPLQGVSPLDECARTDTADIPKETLEAGCFTMEYRVFGSAPGDGEEDFVVKQRRFFTDDFLSGGTPAPRPLGFRITPNRLTAGSGETVVIEFVPTNDATATLTLGGTGIGAGASISLGVRGGDRNLFSWQGTDATGRFLPPDFYTVTIVLENGHGRTTRTLPALLAIPGVAGETATAQVSTLALSRTESGLLLTWTSISEAVRYGVYRSATEITGSNIATAEFLGLVEAPLVSFDDPDARDGPWFYAVTVWDAAGREGPPSPNAVWDLAPPTVSISSPTERSVVAGPVDLRGEVFGATTYVIEARSAATSTWIEVSRVGVGGDLSGLLGRWVPPADASGEWRIRVRAIDVGRNEAMVEVGVSVALAPSVRARPTSVSPLTVPAGVSAAPVIVVFAAVGDVEPGAATVEWRVERDEIPVAAGSTPIGGEVVDGEIHALTTLEIGVPLVAGDVVAVWIEGAGVEAGGTAAAPFRRIGVEAVGAATTYFEDFEDGVADGWAVDAWRRSSTSHLTVVTGASGRFWKASGDGPADVRLVDRSFHREARIEWLVRPETTVDVANSFDLRYALDGATPEARGYQLEFGRSGIFAIRPPGSQVVRLLRWDGWDPLARRNPSVTVFDAVVESAAFVPGETYRVAVEWSDTGLHRVQTYDSAGAIILAVEGIDATYSAGEIGMVAAPGMEIDDIRIGGAAAPMPMGPPVSLAALARPAGRVDLAWSPPGEGRPYVYRLYRSRDGGAFAKIADVSSTLFEDAPPAEGRWFYAVSAIGLDGLEGPYSAFAEALADSTPPGPVSNLAATPGLGGAVRLAWTAPAETDIAAYRAERDGVIVIETTRTTVDLPAYDDVVPLRYEVRAVDAAGNIGPETGPVGLGDTATVLDVVLEVSTTGPTNVLTWSPTLDEPVTILRASSPFADRNFAEAIGEVSPNATAFVDPAPPPDGYYRLATATALSRAVYADRAPPVVRIDTPSLGTSIFEAFEIRGVVADVSGISVTRLLLGDGIETDVIGEWYGDLPQGALVHVPFAGDEEGPRRIVLFAEDRKGNRAETFVDVRYESTAAVAGTVRIERVSLETIERALIELTVYGPIDLGDLYVTDYDGYTDAGAPDPGRLYRVNSSQRLGPGSHRVFIVSRMEPDYPPPLELPADSIVAEVFKPDFYLRGDQLVVTDSTGRALDAVAWIGQGSSYHEPDDMGRLVAAGGWANSGDSVGIPVYLLDNGFEIVRVRPEDNNTSADWGVRDGYPPVLDVFVDRTLEQSTGSWEILIRALDPNGPLPDGVIREVTYRVVPAAGGPALVAETIAGGALVDIVRTLDPATLPTDGRYRIEAEAADDGYRVSASCEIDRTPPGEVGPFQTEPSDRVLRISWPQPMGDDIAGYLVRRTPEGGTAESVQILAPIGDLVHRTSSKSGGASDPAPEHQFSSATDLLYRTSWRSRPNSNYSGWLFSWPVPVRPIRVEITWERPYVPQSVSLYGSRPGWEYEFGTVIPDPNFGVLSIPIESTDKITDLYISASGIRVGPHAAGVREIRIVGEDDRPAFYSSGGRSETVSYSIATFDASRNLGPWGEAGTVYFNPSPNVTLNVNPEGADIRAGQDLYVYGYVYDPDGVDVARLEIVETATDSVVFSEEIRPGDPGVQDMEFERYPSTTELNGTYFIRLIGRDMLGKEASESRPIRVDGVAPTTTFERLDGDRGLYRSTDEMSGVAAIHVTFDSGSFTAYPGDSVVLDLPATAGVTQFYGVDGVGNVETTRSGRVDVTAPNVRVADVPGETISYRATPSVVFDVSDSGAGVETTGVSVTVTGAPMPAVAVEAVPGSWDNGPRFDLLIGQPNISTTTSGCAANLLGGLDQVSLDSDGSLWVADAWGNNRIVRFPAPFASGMSANLVLGQPDFTSSVPAGGAAGLDMPTSVAFDAEGRAYVADYGHGRVVRFSPPFSNGMSADLVLGKADFDGTPVGNPAADLVRPSSVAFGPDGRLYVAEDLNNRIVIFAPPFENGETAVGVLGAPDLYSVVSGPDARRFANNSLWQISFDAGGRLYAADGYAHRVLVFEPPFEDGETAVAVVGQPDFVSAASGLGPDRFNLPWYARVGADDRLYVGDYVNSRYLVFDLPVPETGASAVAVIGQGDLYTDEIVPGSNDRFNIRSSLGGAVFDKAEGILFIAQHVRVLGIRAPPGNLRATVGPIDVFDLAHGTTVTVGASAVDRIGNGPTTETAVFTVVDDVAPTTALEIGAPWIDVGGETLVGATTPMTITAEDPDGKSAIASVERAVDGVFEAVAGAFTLAGFADGTHAIAHRATDAAGNVGATTTETVVLDATPPAVECLTTIGETATYRSTPTFVFTVSDAFAGLDTTTLGTSVTGVPNAPVTIVPSGDGYRMEVGPLDLFALPHGTAVSVEARATDRVGNAAVRAVSFTVVDDVAPTSKLEVGDPKFTLIGWPPTLTATGTISIPNARAIAISPKGDTLIAVVSSQSGPYVYFISTETPAVMNRMQYALSGMPMGVTILPDGGTGYVADVARRVFSFDLGTRQPTGMITFPYGGPGYELSASPDGAEVFLGASGGPASYHFIDVASKQTVASRYAPSDVELAAWSPDGRKVYAVTANGRAIFEIDRTTREITRTFPMPGWGTNVAVTPDGGRLVVPVPGTNQIQIVDLATGTSRFLNVPGGGYPMHAGIAPDGRLALISFQTGSAVVALDLQTETLLPGRLSLSGSNGQVVFDPAGRRAYVLSQGNSLVNVVEIRYPEGGTLIGQATPLSVIGEDPDAKSAIASTERGVDGGAFEVVSGPFTLAGRTDGSHAIRHRATDAAGNVGVARTDTLILDAVAPTIGVSAPVAGNVFRAGRDTIRITYTVADDRDPAPTSTAFLTDLEEGTRVDVVNGQALDPATLDDGAWQLTVIADDFVLNRSQAVVGPFSVVHDILPPRTSLTVGTPRAVGGADGSAPGETIVTRATQFALTAIDDLFDVGDGVGIGVASTTYTIDGGSAVAGTAFTLAGLAEGAHTISFGSVDAVGNAEAAKTATVQIDATPPVVTASGDPGETASYRATPTIIFEVDDALAGVDAASLRATVTGIVGAPVVVIPTAEGYRIEVGPLNLFPLAHGTPIRVTAAGADLLANASAAEIEFTVVDDVPPGTEVGVGDTRAVLPSWPPTFAVTGTIPIPNARAIAISPNGETLIAVVSSNDGPYVHFISTATQSVIERMQYAPSGMAIGVTVMPNGGSGYVADAQARLFSFDLGTRQPTGMVSLPFGGYGGYEIAASPDGGEVIVSMATSPNGYHFVDVATNQVVASRFAPNDVEIPAWSPDGRKVYAVTTNGQAVYEIDRTTREITRSFPMPGWGASVAVTPDGARLVAPVGGTNQIQIIDVATGASRLIDVPGGGYPIQAAIAPGGRLALISFQTGSAVVALDLQTETLLPDRVTLSGSNGQVVFDPTGLRAYVLSSGSLVNVVEIHYPERATVVAPTTPMTVTAEDPDGKSAITGIEYGLSPLRPYTGPFTLAGETAGVRAIQHRATDAAGNVGAVRTDTFVLDVVAPTIVVTSPTVGGRYVAGRDEVKITFTVIDNSDPAPTVVAFLTDVEDGTRIDVTNGQAIDPAAIDDGMWQLTVSARDFVGNETMIVVGPFEVVHDALPPRTTLAVGAPQAAGGADGAAPGATFVAGATALSLAAVDDLVDVGDGAGLGVEATWYALDGEAEAPYAGTFTLAGRAEGARAVGYRSVDVIGNAEAAQSATLWLDEAAPTISVSVGTPKVEVDGVTWVTSATPIDATASDAGVGLASFATPTFPLLEGPQALVYGAADLLGHAAEKTLEVTVDNTPPVISVTVGEPKHVVGGVTYVTSATPIAATAVDAGVGLGAIEEPVMPTSEGVHVLEWKATDLLGNEAAVTLTVTVDRTPPATTISVDVKDTTGVILIPESRISLDAEDIPAGGACGVASTWYSIDGETAVEYQAPFMPRSVVSGGLAFGAHEVRYWSADNIGNTEAAGTFAFTLSPALAVSRRIDLSPRVLVWWNTGSAPVEAVEDVLATGALSLDGVTGKDTFVAVLRTGAYNLFVVIGEAERLEAAEAEELAAHVDAGAGLVAFEYDRIDGPMLGHDRGEDGGHGGDAQGADNVARDNVLGVKVAGLNVVDGTVEVAAGVLADAAYQFVAPGQADRVRERYEAEMLGRFTGEAPESPAITLRRYGAGKALFLDFGVAGTPDTLLERLVGAVAPETGPVVPGGVVVLAIDVKSLVVPLDLTVSVEEQLPSGVTVLDVRPAPRSQQPNLITWYVVLDVGDETTLAYSASFPEGTSEPEAIVSYAVRGTYWEFGRFSVEVTAAARDDLAGSASDSLYAIAAMLPTQGGDQQRVEEAARKVEAVENAVYTNPDGVEEAIGDVLGAIEAVTRAESPAGVPVRAVLDRLVVTLEREWIRLGGD